MGKKSFAVGVGSVLAIVGCGASDPHAVNAAAEDGSVARASIESPTCGARATLIELPEHCRWPDVARRSSLLSTSANVVVAVDVEGKPHTARVVGSTSSGDAELEAAVVACAMQGRYRPAWDGAGETCAVTIRLARYASDVVRAAWSDFR